MLFSNETDLARVVVDWLEDQHYQVYQEVQAYDGGPVADIVATQGVLVVVVECKLSLGLRVIEQARFWNRRAHLTYVAVPWPKRDARFATEVAGRFGLGVLWVSDGSYGSDHRVDERSRPEFCRRADVERLRGRLTDGHRTYAQAGNSHSRRWSPFKQTSMDVARYVRDHPGATLSEVIGSVKTHYRTPATARSCLAQWAEAGKLEGVRLERHDGKIRLWPKP